MTTNSKGMKEEELNISEWESGFLDGVYDTASELSVETLKDVYPSIQYLSSLPTRYEKRAILGKGAIKQVYRCYDHQMQTEVAFAEPHADVPLQYYEQFIHEAWLTTQLDHPNIITVFDVGIQESGKPFFTMSLKGESTLTNVMERLPRLSDLLDIFHTICDAISYAHQHGVIHLDLKPDNIQCDDNKSVVVCDWGLAKSTLKDIDNSVLESQISLTSEFGSTLHGTIKGSPGYLSPEQIHQNLPRDERSDIYSLGCILHEIITGFPPQRGKIEDILEHTKLGENKPIEENYPRLRLDKQLSAIVNKCLQLLPDERYQSVAELKDDLRRYQSNEVVSLYQNSSLMKFRLWCSRHRMVLTSAVALLCIILYGANHFYHQQISAQASKKALSNRLNNAHEELNLVDLLANDLGVNYKKQMLTLANQSLNGNNHPIDEAVDRANLYLNILEEHPLDYENFPITYTRARFIMLDLQSIHSYLPLRSAQHNKVQSCLNIANQFPQYHFSPHNRPTVNELLNFINACEHSRFDNLHLLIECILYDHAKRSEHTSYDTVIAALLSLLNQGRLSCEQTYFKKNLVISSRGTMFHYSDRRNVSLLSLLRAEKLTLNIESPFALEHLNGAQITSLDLRGCNELISDTPDGEYALLPKLKKVIVSSDKDLKLAQKKFHSENQINYSVQPLQ